MGELPRVSFEKAVLVRANLTAKDGVPMLRMVIDADIGPDGDGVLPDISGMATGMVGQPVSVDVVAYQERAFQLSAISSQSPTPEG